MNRKISAAILAGGANKRFNCIIKANISVDGRKIILRITDTIEDVFEEVIIVTNTPEEFGEFSNCLIVRDHFLNMGPLGGIHAALKASSGESVFIFAGDMPYLDKEIIISQIECSENMECDILIPKINENIEPLHAIYSRRIIGELENYLAEKQDYAVRAFFKRMNIRYFQMDDSEEVRRAFTNINSMGDISVIKKAPLEN
jgi:molybdopterin-guanine dinucleotide biosynthesis protein A